MGNDKTVFKGWAQIFLGGRNDGANFGAEGLHAPMLTCDGKLARAHGHTAQIVPDMTIPEIRRAGGVMIFPRGNIREHAESIAKNLPAGIFQASFALYRQKRLDRSYCASQNHT